MPPMIQAGSRPVSRSTKAIIAAVVVLPWAPPTTIAGWAATSSARNVGRGRSPRSGAGAPSRRRPPSPSGGAGSPPMSTSIPSSEPMKIVSRRSQPAHLGPERPRDVGVGGHARARRSRRSRACRPAQAAVLSGGQGRSPPRRSGRPRRRGPSTASPRASRRAGPDRRAATPTSAGTDAISAFGTTTAPPPRSKWRALSVWWSAVAYGYGTRIDGVPAAASSHTVPPARETATSAAASTSPKWSVCGISR